MYMLEAAAAEPELVAFRSSAAADAPSPPPPLPIRPSAAAAARPSFESASASPQRSAALGMSRRYVATRGVAQA